MSELHRQFIPRERFVSKWATKVSHRTAGGVLASKGWRCVGGVFYEQCVTCKVVKERTMDNFYPSTTPGKSFEQWFEASESGLEPFRNSACHPCRVCSIDMTRRRNTDTEGDGYIKTIMRKYKALFRGTDFGVGWYLQEEAMPDGECPITGGRLPFVREPAHPLSMGIHNLATRLPHEVYDVNNHVPGTTRGGYSFANCMQGCSVRGVYTAYIPSLPDAYRALYRDVIADYQKTPEQLEAEEIRAGEKLTDRVYSLSSKMKQTDTSSGLDGDLHTAEAVRASLRRAGMRCATSNVTLELKTGARKAHGDRIDDRIGHTDSNVEWKCHLFCNQNKLSRYDFLCIFLSQEWVPLPPDVRVKAEADLVHLNICRV